MGEGAGIEVGCKASSVPPWDVHTGLLLMAAGPTEWEKPLCWLPLPLAHSHFGVPWVHFR